MTDKIETTGPGVETGAADNVELDKPLVIRSTVCENYTPFSFTARIPRDLIVLGLDVVTVDHIDDFVLFYAGNEGATEKTHEVTFNYARVSYEVPADSGQHLALKLFNGEFVAVFSTKSPPINLKTGKADEGIKLHTPKDELSSKEYPESD